jgi:signal transduction histidine kinase
MAKKRSTTRKGSFGTIQSDFITLTSHQLRTPLSGMKWLLELLKKEGTGNLNRKQKDFIDKIYNSNERMIALVNDLLEVSRLESGESKLYLQPTDIVTVINVLIREKKDEIKKHGTKISFTIEQEPFPLVRTEPNRLKQALNNLITNSINYSGETGLVHINLKVQDGEALFSIEDKGVGIPKAQQKQVFEKFFRGNNVLQFETTGTGLGLYITKAFIESSKGRIWFKSKENEGTTVFFTLPIIK